MIYTVAEVRAQIPAYCGPMGNLRRGGDLNSDWTCTRTARLHMIDTLISQVESMEDVSRIRNTHRLRGRMVWLATYGQDHLRDALRYSAELPECGHSEADRQTMTREEALPPCTC